jgi:hypothetical protein
MAVTKIRTNYIKLSLTDKEYDDLVNYSESINKTISGSVRDLLDFASDIGFMYGSLQEAYMKLKNENDPNHAEFEKQMLTFLKDLPFQNQMDIYSYFNKLNTLVPFSKDWKNVNKR